MKEYPIIFTAAMVRAILEGRKTQTRRIIKPQPSGGVEHREMHSYFIDEGMFDGWVDLDPESKRGFVSPYGWHGDRLWVRENWMPCDAGDTQVKVLYKANNDTRPDGISVDDFGCAKWFPCSEIQADQFKQKIALMEVFGDKWTPSIFMPRWASRITLDVASVCVERVQDISDNDIRAEGIDLTDGMDTARTAPRIKWKNRFAKTWDEINAKRGFGWDKNPWVFVIDFKLHECKTAAKDGLRHAAEVNGLGDARQNHPELSCL